jgi:flagellar motor protein MotB
MRSRPITEELNFWPVIADSFVAILGVFVFLILLALSDLGRGTLQIPKWVTIAEERFVAKLEAEKQKGLLTFSKESRSVRITLTDKDLGFAVCEWTVEPRVGARIRDLFRDLGQTLGSPISDIRIEGHADVMRAGQCQELKPWKDNLQLSQNRARGVLEAILDVPASESAAELDLVLSSASERLAFVNGPAAELRYVREMFLGGRVSAAGFGSTKTLPGLAPEDARNRRVVISVTFCGGTADCPQATEAPARQE